MVKFFRLATLILFLKPGFSLACLWNSSIDPVFLNQDEIEICINRPSNEVLQDFGTQVAQATTHVRSAIRSLEESSVVNFNLQPGFCSELEEDNLRPRMRIELIPPPQTTGRAITDNGFGLEERNLLIPFLDQNNEVRTQGNLTFMTQHEILHLLGIEHDDRSLEGVDVGKLLAQHPNFLVLTEEPAQESVMNLMMNELTPASQGVDFREHMAVTSHDLQCIQSVYREHNRLRLLNGSSGPNPEDRELDESSLE